MIAVLYDLHGNLRALEAVLADAQSAGAASFALGGDYAAFGPEPAEVVERAAGLDTVAVLAGNWERWAAEPDALPVDEVVQGAAEAVRKALGSDVVAEQAGLPWSARVGDAELVHASRVSDVRSFGVEAGDDDEELLAGFEGPRLIFGHTHLAFRREGPGGVELVNPGSVGLPLDGDVRASYLLLHDDGSLEHRRVAYDHEGAAAALRRRYGPGWADTVAGRIETASW